MTQHCIICSMQYAVFCWGNKSICWGNEANLLRKWSKWMGKWSKLFWGDAPKVKWSIPVLPYIGTLCKSPFKRYKWLTKNIFSVKYVERYSLQLQTWQAYCHHRGNKSLISPNLCQLWIQFDHNFQLKRHKMVHTGPTRWLIFFLKAYIDFVNSENDSDRENYLKLHIKSVKDHIKELSKKDYSRLEGVNSPDFVFMFVPNLENGTKMQYNLYFSEKYGHAFFQLLVISGLGLGRPNKKCTNFMVSWVFFLLFSQNWKMVPEYNTNLSFLKMSALLLLKLLSFQTPVLLKTTQGQLILKISFL